MDWALREADGLLWKALGDKFGEADLKRILESQVKGCGLSCGLRSVCGMMESSEH